jgi:hypothetical protein
MASRSRARVPGFPVLGRQDVAILAGLGLGAIVLVALSLQREPPPGYPVSQLEPVEVGPRLHGPAIVTLDASVGWVYFSFATASTVHAPGPLDWDLAFRRFHVMVNGGAGFAGRGAVADLGAVDLDAVTAAPDAGWVDRSARDSTNEAIARWYDYSFTSHLLTPRRRAYAIRTADGRYALLRFLSYYCDDGRPGCMTFEYVYQGDGTRVLAADAIPEGGWPPPSPRSPAGR